MTKRDSPCELTAKVLAHRLRDRTLSAAEVLEAHLSRIEQLNAKLNAVVSLDAERARKRAHEADRALARGELWGPLHGVPMTLKDGHEVAGLRTTVGTKELDHVADQDGTVTARLKAAGAIILGHSNVPPWLSDHQTNNPIFGRTNNPWDLERTPGGSSGGAAAALAAGMTPLEIGSDLVGSIRLPAHFCGIYGLKPTEHRVPLTGFVRPPEGMPRPVRIMACIGPMARDLDDLELALSIIAGPDGFDGDVPPVPLTPEPVKLSELRLAIAPTLPGATVAKSLQRQLKRVASEASDAGAKVDERLPDVDWPRLYELFGNLIGVITGVFNPTAKLSDEQRSLAFYLRALEERDRMIAKWDAFFEDFDAILVAPAMTNAFVHQEPGKDFDVDGQGVSYSGHGALHAFSNLTGLPGLAVPAIHDGLPVGIQIIGPRWSELRLLRIARELERHQLLPGFQPPPGN